MEDIEKLIGKVNIQVNQSSDPKAPGQLKSHYAPHKSMVLGNIPELTKRFVDKKIVILGFGKIENVPSHIPVKNLSGSGNIREAAMNLFSYLRELDESDADLIIAQLVPSNGLGIAINDRLIRAAAES